MNIKLNDESIPSMRRLNFDKDKDFIVINGSVVIADYIDKFENSIGLYCKNDESLPVTFIYNNGKINSVNINVFEEEDGHKNCFIEYAYNVSRDEFK